jgi:dTDP-4-amino-4,6-dideoxygalactose transaminase/ribosomal protein S18 acetylase RimI-like enzyme
MNISIESITKENLKDILPELISLESNWAEIGESSWTKENFELDLPLKWRLSILARFDSKIAGYAICSVSDGIARLNKILVSNDFRGKGLAKMLWDEFIARCKEIGIKKIEFKAAIDNFPAINFYKSKGCVFYGSELGTDFKPRYNVKYVLSMPQMISHSRPSIGGSDIVAVANAVSDGNIMTGKRVSEFIKEMKFFVGRKYGSATNSGSSALHLALRALDVNPGDEVIIPSYACNSVLNAVRYCGVKPVFADINDKSEIDDYNISFDSAKKLVSEKTKAMILPHMFGKPIENIESFKSLKVPIIEDCALSIGAKVKGKNVGTFGDISVFSFYATKVITSGTGGMLLTDDLILSERIKSLMQYDNKSDFKESYNYGMNDIQAALGLSQLRKISYFISSRKRIAKIYSDIFQSSKKDFALPNSKDNIFFRYIVRHDKASEFISSLAKANISAQRPVPNLLHRFSDQSDNDFPNSIAAFRESVSIPIYPTLNQEEAEDIAAVLINWKSIENIA